MSRRTRLIRAIPTEAFGILFRSRLEAQWARLFTQLEWDWTYEPDLQAGFVIPDFLLNFPARPVVLECKPALTPRELGAARRTLVRKMPAWLTNDVLRELQVLKSDPEVPDSEIERCMADLVLVERGQNPTGFSRRILVVGPQLFRTDDHVTVDGYHGFCLCTHPGGSKHIGLSVTADGMCLLCSASCTSWVPPDVMFAAWRECGAAQQWLPKKRKRKH